MRGPGKGKTNNPNGRPAGTPNRTTKEARELLEVILFGQVENINSALERLRTTDPAKFIDACSKMFAYVLPKKTDITSNDNTLTPPIMITVKSEDVKDALQKLSEDN